MMIEAPHDMAIHAADQLNVLGICAGTGALELGIRIAEPRAHGIAYVEREAGAAAALVASMEAGWVHPAPIWSDLGTFDARPLLGLVDILASGDPCQPNSVAGKRQGAEDDRFLIDQLLRIVGECRPDRIVRENVTGNADGQLAALVGPLEKMGYRVAAGIFTASECGFVHDGEWVGPKHRRARLVIVADRDGGRFAIERQSQLAGIGGASGDELDRRDGARSPMADPGDGQLSGARRGSQGRNGPRSPGADVGDAQGILWGGEFEPPGAWCGWAGFDGASLGLGDAPSPGSHASPPAREDREVAGRGPWDAQSERRGGDVAEPLGGDIQRRGRPGPMASAPRAPSGEGDQERGALDDRGPAPELVDSPGERRGEGRPESGIQRGRDSAPQPSGELADSGGAGLQGGERREPHGPIDGEAAPRSATECRRAYLPPYAPGPGHPAWGAILDADPLLAPALGTIDFWAIARRNLGLAPVGGAVGRRGGMAWDLDPATTARLKSEVRRVADALAFRTERLRACGNGVVPLVIAYAWVALGNLLATDRAARPAPASLIGRHDA